MRATLAALMILGLAACGDEAPKPAAKPIPEAPVAKPAPPPAPEAKAPEAPKPDPNKELASKVTRWGTAATAAERKRAATVASKVEGVTSVENKLAVVKGS